MKKSLAIIILFAMARVRSSCCGKTPKKCVTAGCKYAMGPKRQYCRKKTSPRAKKASGRMVAAMKRVAQIRHLHKGGRMAAALKRAKELAPLHKMLPGQKYARTVARLRSR